MAERGNAEYGAGDTLAYRSVTTREWVTWTRNERGDWAPDDGREVFATDEDVDLARSRSISAECVYTPAHIDSSETP